MDADVLWECPACGQAASSAYNGPYDKKMILDQFNTQHLWVSPQCPHRFSNVDLNTIPIDGPRDQR